MDWSDGKSIPAEESTVAIERRENAKKLSEGWNRRICKDLVLADMRYYADAADAVCVKNIRFCVKFMLEFTHLTRNVTY